MENEQTNKPDGEGERDDDKSPRIWAAKSTDGIASSTGGADAEAAEQSTPTSLLEQLLSPLVLQRMMACGGSVCSSPWRGRTTTSWRPSDILRNGADGSP